MGVTLDLRLVDHERIVVRGLQAVNDAIRHHDPDRLRDYLKTLPIDVDPSVFEYHESRLFKLREVHAPEIIIQNEERFLRMATGEVYRPDAFKNSSFDELRHLLGTWCWLTHHYSLDKAWNELRWFLEPTAGSENQPLQPMRPPPIGDPKQSVFGKALDGSGPYPTDELGDPVVCTLGSQEKGCSGYNPPDACRDILARLQVIDPHAWEEHMPFRRELYRQAVPDLTEEDIAGFVEDELSAAREAFSVVVAAYTKAVEKGFGVSCEYSL
jgi:hypothetical protein